jgi:hypothetical protein
LAFKAAPFDAVVDLFVPVFRVTLGVADRLDASSQEASPDRLRLSIPATRLRSARARGVELVTPTAKRGQVALVLIPEVLVGSVVDVQIIRPAA